MIKNIIREVGPEQCEFSYYFDDDGLREAGGDYCYNLFIVPCRGYIGFNEKEYENVCKTAENIQDGFYDVDDKSTDYNGDRLTYKGIMEGERIPYNSRKCHVLREWAKSYDALKPDGIAEFLTITTGKKWDSIGVCGYSQGDYVDVVYCVEHYSEPRIYGEVWLGCAKEFCVIDLDENGNEGDTCYGYIVADSQAREDEDYKRLVCEWACIEESETQLEMIDGYHTYTKYDYRIA